MDLLGFATSRLTRRLLLALPLLMAAEGGAGSVASSDQPAVGGSEQAPADPYSATDEQVAVVNADVSPAATAKQPSASPLPPADAAPAGESVSALPEDGNLDAYSDRALTQLAAKWEQLDDAQRRGLLMGVKRRMARKQAVPVQIRTQRRYGRTIRRPDGSVVRIQSTRIRIRREGAPPAHGDGPAFGAGFEQRTDQRQPDPDTSGAVLVNGPTTQER